MAYEHGGIKATSSSSQAWAEALLAMTKTGSMVPAARCAAGALCCAIGGRRRVSRLHARFCLMSYDKIPAARLERRPEHRHRTGSPRRFVTDALCGGRDGRTTSA
jgi:hypothetical protein